MSRAIENWLFVGLMLVILALIGRPTAIMGQASIDSVTDLIGLVISVVGLLMRVVSRDWKVNHGGSDLVTTGPYSVVRHPMYVGSFLAGFGLCFILGSFLFLAVYTLCFLVVHALVAKREEDYLRTKWPEKHRSYSSCVPAFCPSIVGFLRFLAHWIPWIPSVPKALIRERSAICGVLTGACVSESAADVIASGWAKTHAEVTFWLIVGVVIIGVWIITGSNRVLVHVKR